MDVPQRNHGGPRVTLCTYARCLLFVTCVLTATCPRAGFGPVHVALPASYLVCIVVTIVVAIAVATAAAAVAAAAVVVAAGGDLLAEATATAGGCSSSGSFARPRRGERSKSYFAACSNRCHAGIGC